MLKIHSEMSLPVLNSNCLGIRMNNDDAVTDVIKNIKSKNQNLSTGEINQLTDILNKNSKVFSDKPGLIKGFEAKINLSNKEPFIGKSYPIPYHKKKEVQKEIESLLENGIISRSDSPYNNSLVAVSKKDGSTRVCLDSRRLNKYIINDCERTERIENILQRFSGTKYLSTIDLTQGFLQLSLNKESRKYVSFVFNGNNYSYNRLPFGLKISSSMFIKAMTHVFGTDYDDFLVMYIDDLLIFSQSFEEHVRHIDLVLNRLKEYGATVKLSKSKFLEPEVNFLGYVISSDGIKMDPEKINKILELKDPRNLKELQSMLGLMNYYRGFHYKYSELTNKFSHLLSSRKRWIWNKTDSDNFNILKKEFLNHVMLGHPNFQKEFFIGTDASDNCVASVLYQLNELGEQKVIMFASRRLLDTERAYSITEKELLALVFACNKFRAYLVGHPKIIVRTDHKALTFLSNCKLTHGRLLRWVLVLQEFNLEIEYIPGKLNVVCDVLSRINDTGMEDKCKNNILVLKNKLELGFKESEIGELLKDFEEAQRQDKAYNNIFEILQDREHENHNKVKTVFRVHNNLLFKNDKEDDEHWRLCIPQSKVVKLVDYAHRKYGHFGGHKIYLTLREYCVFNNMEKTIKNQLKKCMLCQKTKHNNKHQIGTMHSVTAERPLQLVSVDLIGELPVGRFGVKYIFSIVDIFTKHVKLYAVRRATSTALLVKITDYCKQVGKIECILSDNGTQFASQKWYQGLDKLGIKYIHSSVYNPQSNPVERYNKEINRLCRLYCSEKHTKWSDYLHYVEDCLNFTVNGVTEQVPYEIMFGKKGENIFKKLIHFPKINFDYNRILQLVRDKTRDKIKQRKLKFDKKCTAVKYEIGDKVLIKTHFLSDKLGKKIKKFFHLYEGPYVIVGIKMDNAYVLEDLATREIKGTYNVRQLRKLIE